MVFKLCHGPIEERDEAAELVVAERAEIGDDRRLAGEGPASLGDAHDERVAGVAGGAVFDEAGLFKLDEHLAQGLRANAELLAHVALAHLGVLREEGEDAALAAQGVERGRSRRMLNGNMPLLKAALGADELLYDFASQVCIGVAG